MLEQEPWKGWKAEKEKVANTTKEKTNSDQPHADRAKSLGTTRTTARHEDLHRRPRRQWQAQKAHADAHGDTKTETHAVTQRGQCDECNERYE